MGHWRYIGGSIRASRYPSRVDLSQTSDRYTPHLTNVLHDTAPGSILCHRRLEAIPSSELRALSAVGNMIAAPLRGRGSQIVLDDDDLIVKRANQVPGTLSGYLGLFRSSRASTLLGTATPHAMPPPPPLGAWTLESPL